LIKKNTKEEEKYRRKLKMGPSDFLSRLLGRSTKTEAEELPTLDSLGEDEYPSSPLEVNDDDFDKVIQRFPLVVVDCWAPWCAPCHMVAPVISELAKDYQGKIVFGKLDVDENQKKAMEYGIMSIPALLVFQNSELVDQIIGAQPRTTLEPKITKYL
jgi:thioredoxin 1